MFERQAYNGGENFNLHQVLMHGRRKNLRDRSAELGIFLRTLTDQRALLTRRCIVSPADRQVIVRDPYTGEYRSMLMFGSNNYLGFANHPYVLAKVRQALNRYGAGIGGPPLLNGTTGLHRALEERLAAFKSAEDCLIFSSGYGANVGLVTALVTPHDEVFYDAYSHASFCDGLKMAGSRGVRFSHNNVEELRALLDNSITGGSGDRYIGVEGVYSMDGDLAPLDRVVEIARDRGAYILLDDAHGTGVMGASGRGTAEHFGVDGRIDVTLGTFSKTFAVAGGFVTAGREIIDYLRLFARSYMFSASLPPQVLAAVDAGLDLLDQDSGLLERLRSNTDYAASALRSLGFPLAGSTPVIPLHVPEHLDIRAMGYELHRRGMFVNSVEFPAVPVSEQRFRVSIMATHTHDDIDRLVESIDAVWSLARRHADAPSSILCVSPETGRM